jgi:hypothetical protein
MAVGWMRTRYLRNETKDGTKVHGPAREIAGTELDKTLEKDQSKHRACYFWDAPMGLLQPKNWHNKANFDT